MQMTVLLDRSAAEGLISQITAQLREGIRVGRIRHGARLPSSRRLAEQLAVSRNTVVRAYEILESEGLVEARPASGIFAVADRDALSPPPLPPSRARAGGAEPARPGGEREGMPPPRPLARARTQPGSQARTAPDARLAFDFTPGRLAPSQFPLKTWRRLVHSTLSQASLPGLAGGAGPGGLFALRAAVAGHLAMSRGIVADPNQVIVTSGVQEGLSLAAALFLEPGRTAVVESPCRAASARVFEAAGARLARAPVDQGGAVIADLPSGGASLLLATPTHQFPLGATLAMDRREALIGWARRTGCYIVEDDRDGDFHHEGPALPALAAMAPDCTIHLGGFSRTLGAGLRLGWMVAPPQLVEAAREAKALLDGGAPWLEQATLAEFIRAGSYAAHLQRSRTRHRRGRDALIHALRRQFGDVRLSGEAAGLHLLWRLPPGVPAAPLLEAMARRARIGLCGLASAGATEEGASGLADRAVLLGYAAMSPERIEKGVARLSDMIDDTLDARPDLLDELLLGDPAPVPPASPGAGEAQPAPRIRRRAALHAAPPHDAASPAVMDMGRSHAMQIVRGIYRYPVKGLSGQALTGVTLEPDRPFPFDRVFALARPGVPVDRADPKWAKKGLFVMLMLDEALASVRTRLDPETLVLTATRDGETVLEADLATEAGRARTERFFAGLTPGLKGTPTLLRSREGHFMDKPDPVLSLINLATLRALEEDWGASLDPLRFRANFYVDGLRPWQEFDWIGSDLRLGDAVFRVDRRNGRCGATNVNPKTGERDRDIPARLRATLRHKDLGVYLLVRQGGKVIVGDPVAAPREAGALPPAPAAFPLPDDGRKRFICRGCYYIHETAAPPPIPAGDIPVPAAALLSSPAFEALDDAWRCPDCGGEKSAFRPYVTV